MQALSRAQNITPNTRHAYAARLTSVPQRMQRRQPNLQMHTMLQDGRRLVKTISALYQPGSSRCAALTAALAVYRADKSLRLNQPDSWAVLKQAMAKNRCIEARGATKLERRPCSKK